MPERVILSAGKGSLAWQTPKTDLYMVKQPRGQEVEKPNGQRWNHTAHVPDERFFISLGMTKRA